MGNAYFEMQKESMLIMAKESCDKYDYLTAVACGAIGSVIDVFLVNIPGESVLGNWTDKLTDNAVYRFAKHLGWKPQKNETDDVNHAIAFLERKFKVNYDQSTNQAASEVFGITPDNHHMKSLAHSPDIIGLFFSILNQFTSTSSFLSEGQLITMDTETFELTGHDLKSKLFCGSVNWLGHLISDVAGGNGRKGRGMGIVLPFYELFNMCTFGNFKVGEERCDLATIATKAFEQGYDFRFGIAMSIPVAITNLLIKVIWSIRQRFQYHKPLKECIPISIHGNLRKMLLVGNGVFCVVDIIDSGVRSGGSFLTFFMRLNLVGWCKFVKLVIKEICVQLGIKSHDIDDAVEDAYRITDAINEYLEQIKQVDINQYKKEVSQYIIFVNMLKKSNSEEELNHCLKEIYCELGIVPSWEGDFDEFMSNKNERLVFE